MAKEPTKYRVVKRTGQVIREDTARRWALEKTKHQEWKAGSPTPVRTRTGQEVDPDHGRTFVSKKRKERSTSNLRRRIERVAQEARVQTMAAGRNFFTRGRR